MGAIALIGRHFRVFLLLFLFCLFVCLLVCLARASSNSLCVAATTPGQGDRDRETQRQSERKRENDQRFEDSWNDQEQCKCAILGLLFLVLWWVLFLKQKVQRREMWTRPTTALSDGSKENPREAVLWRWRWQVKVVSKLRD